MGVIRSMEELRKKKCSSIQGHRAFCIFRDEVDRVALSRSSTSPADSLFVAGRVHKVLVSNEL